MQQTFYHTLSNGIRIIHRQTASEVAWLGIIVGTGTRDEKKGESGLAHFIEHTVFKGTQHHSARQLLNLTEGLGGELNAFTTKEETTFYAATRTKYVKRTVQLLAEMVFMPTFPQKEIEKEKQVIIDEIESYNDSPSELIYDDFENLLFAGHQLQSPILGTARSVKKLDGEKASSFMREHYTTDKIVFFSLSSLPIKQVISIAERAFQCQEQTYCTDKRVAPTATINTEATYHKHTHQAHVMMGMRAYPLGDKKQHILYLLNNILGGGSMNSKLNLKLREDKGLVYNIESIYTPMSDTGYWAVYYATEPEHKDLCAELVMKELQRLRDEPISTSAFNRYLQQLHTQMAIAAENQENNALNMGKQFLYFNSAPTWQQQFEQIANITPQHLHACINELFEANKIHFLQYC